MFLVLIRPKYRDDKGIHEHEYAHVKQWYKWSLLYLAVLSLFIFGLPEYQEYTLPLIGLVPAVWALLYYFSTSFRLEQEVEAYRAQVKAGADLDKMAAALTDKNYKFNIGFEEAKNLLRD